MPTPTETETSPPQISRSKIKDGFLLRHREELENPRLRRPRSSTRFDVDTEAEPTRDVSRINKARFGAVLRKQKATEIVKALTQAAQPKVIKTAAEISLEASKDENNQYRRLKGQVMNQYYTFHGNYLERMDTPVTAEVNKHSRTLQKGVADPWALHREAQLNIKNSKDRPISSQSYYKDVSPSHDIAIHRDRMVKSATEPISKQLKCKLSAADQIEIPPTVSKRVTFCQQPRAQSATSPQVIISKEESSEIDRDTCEAVEDSQPVVRPYSSPLLRSRIKHTSPWLSPLQMCNVPADAKLRYINRAEKQRFRKLMSDTSRLLNFRSIQAACMPDERDQRLMAYKPKLTAASKAKSSVQISQSLTTEQNNASPDEYTEISESLNGVANHPSLRSMNLRLTQRLAEHRVRSPRRIITSHVDPVRLGSATNKALVASFYSHIEVRN